VSTKRTAARQDRRPRLDEGVDNFSGGVEICVAKEISGYPPGISAAAVPVVKRREA